MQTIKLVLAFYCIMLAITMKNAYWILVCGYWLMNYLEGME